MKIDKTLSATAQIRLWIGHNMKKGDTITARMIGDNFTWLTGSAISSALWALAKQQLLIENAGKEGQANLYKVIADSSGQTVSSPRNKGKRKSAPREPDIPAAMLELEMDPHILEALTEVKITILNCALKLERLLCQLEG